VATDPWLLPGSALSQSMSACCPGVRIVGSKLDRG
jgi:hypothetical protein